MFTTRLVICANKVNRVNFDFMSTLKCVFFILLLLLLLIKIILHAAATQNIIQLQLQYLMILFIYCKTAQPFPISLSMICRCMDICLLRCTNNIKLYRKNSTELLKCSTNPLSVTINPAYGVSCNICTSVTFSATVRKW